MTASSIIVALADMIRSFTDLMLTGSIFVCGALHR